MSVLKKRQQLRKSLNKICAMLLEEVAEMLQEEIVKKKRNWVRKWIEDREATGGSILLMKQLRSEDPQEYRSGLRMTPENFDELLSLVANSIQRKDTLMRDALPARVKLETTLTYLANLSFYCHIFYECIAGLQALDESIVCMTPISCRVQNECAKKTSTTEEIVKQNLRNVIGRSGRNVTRRNSKEEAKLGEKMDRRQRSHWRLHIAYETTPVRRSTRIQIGFKNDTRKILMDCFPLVANSIQRKDTLMRDALPAKS
ncbi:hypothetical protein MML48_5g00001270 [Holotrichia oblita]|uniref:Uncharacterized protein n=1 Tax=Holotrichia oblita TaxID=644536 RepID=A0ACB9T399_HOLOL|nr:hypothetical protein MML48_5g00001270 [Holotrichia oblita]